MEKEQIYKIGLDVIYMSSCALLGKTPDRCRLSEMNFSSLYKMAKQHSMQAIVYLSMIKAMESYPDLEVDEGLIAKWKSDYHAVIKKLVQLDIERENLYSFLDSEGAWYIGLKGIVLSHYYPTLGMRQMTDNDILVDPAYSKKIRDYFVSRGYKIESYGNHCHDVYCKGPLTFEIHRMLAEEVEKTRAAYNYYKNVKNILISDGESNLLRFSDDDFYVYYIFHAYKHFSQAGCGMRTLMDIFVYRSNKELDLNYIDSQLKILGTDSYESSSYRIAEKVFGSDPENLYAPDLLTDFDREVLLYYISSGTFGTANNFVENKLSDMAGGKEITFATRTKYVLERLFPKYEFYKTTYPRASKFLVTIPFLCLFRIFKSLKKGKKISRELKRVNTKR